MIGGSTLNRSVQGLAILASDAVWRSGPSAFGR